MRKFILSIVLFLLLTGSRAIGQEVPVADWADSNTVRSILLQQMSLQKLLIEQADKDGITVSDKEVEGQLDNRMHYFIQLYGTKEKLEQASGKTIYQLKEDNRQTIKDQVLADKMERRILKHVKVSHAEVKAFFNNIPKDSLPAYPGCVEMGQIVIDVATSLDVAPNDTETPLEKLGYIRQELITGKYTFNKAVRKYAANEAVKLTGGMLTDPATGNTLIAVGSLDPSLALLLDGMKAGDYSQPQIFNNATGGRSCRILYLEAKIPAHKANLIDDYDKLQEMALEQKKLQKTQAWFARQ